MCSVVDKVAGGGGPSEGALPDAAGKILVAQTELKAGAVGLGAVIFQAITHIAPAAGFLLGAAFIASQAGHAVTLAYLLAFIVTFTLGISLTQLAKHLPSAGGYFTYVSRTLHPRLGFLTAWLYFLYDPTVTAINLTILGIVTQDTLKQYYGVNIPWPAVVAVLLAIITFIIYRGVKLSGKSMMVLGVVEIVILLAFSLTGFADPGPGGFTLEPFTIDPAFGVSGLALGIVFAIFSFTGFESVAPLAEETRNPRRNLPKAIILSLLFMGVFYVVCTWGLVVGWGIDAFDDTFAGKDVNAFFQLGERLWSGAWVLLLLCLFNSIIAVSISASNAASRVFFAMGRIGALPRWLGRVDRKTKTPRNAIILQTIVTILIAFVGGYAMGPDTIFFWFGVLITLGLVFVYAAGSIGVIRFFWGRKAEFNIFLHLIVPVISVAAVIVVAYYSVKDLSGIYAWVPWVLAIWLALGVGVLIYGNRAGKEDWLLKAGETAFERPADPGELAE